MTSTAGYEHNVFINCPFDNGYNEIFNAILFTVFDCGYYPRCSLEEDNAGEVRIHKIMRIISECHFGLNDISRTELDPKNGLPRFNMPFELGIFLGARRYGNKPHDKKNCLILDREQHRYHKYISDIAGQDVKSHEDKAVDAIKIVRNWLGASAISSGTSIPSAKQITTRYIIFREKLPELCKKLKLDCDDLPYNDYIFLISNSLIKLDEFM